MTAEILAMFADSIITPRPLSKRKREQAQRREIRLAFEAGTISFWEMLAAYESGLDLGGEVENNERENNSYHEDGRRWVPVREDWHVHEDRGFRAIVPAGLMLAFGGVA